MQNDPHKNPGLRSANGERADSTEVPAWRSPSVLIALGVMLLGLGLWVHGTLGSGQEEEGAPGEAEVSSLMDSRVHQNTEADRREDVLSPVSPVAFRLGAGYLGGFFLGWTFRKFITLTLLIAGGLVVMLAVFQGLGWFEVNWSAVDEHLRMSLAWIRGEAGSFRTFVTGYLPSAGAVTGGMAVGFRR